MRVRDIMTTEVVTIDMDASMEDVARIFEAAEFHHLVVVEAGRVIGVLSDRDKLRSVSPFIGKMSERSQDLASLKRRVHQTMTRRPKTARPDDEAAPCGEIMLRDRISCMPVVDDGQALLGIVTIRDYVRLAVDLLRGGAVRRAA